MTFATISAEKKFEIINHTRKLGSISGKARPFPDWLFIVQLVHILKWIQIRQKQRLILRSSPNSFCVHTGRTVEDTDLENMSTTG